MPATAEQVRDYLAESMNAGDFVAGQKLPTERALSDQFGVSRTVVREALLLLEAQRRIVRHVGRGTFVADQPDADSAAEFSPAELIEARMVIEGELAALAVLNASERDVEKIRSMCESLDYGASPTEFEIYDCAFHHTIAVAGQNALLLAGYNLVAAARQNVEWRRLKALRHETRPNRRAEVLDEHHSIVDAIKARDGFRAREAMLHHLYRVRMNLLGR